MKISSLTDCKIYDIFEKVMNYMSGNLIKITGINSEYLIKKREVNTYKVEPVSPIDNQTTTIVRQHEEVKDEFKRLLDIEMKKYK